MGQTDDTRTNEWGSSNQVPDAPHRVPRSGMPPVTAHQSDGSHTVFTESGNSDAWIASELVVSVER